ncbi:MAG: ribonucleoside-diphosphate reductase subunit alpha [Rudaea sp.]|uniref:ribonucleoside-diphosphate reductase subunit alpha n=1 Tax=Rudaea sp. TaxID=2136325 RepID=UPI0039E5A9EA
MRVAKRSGASEPVDLNKIVRAVTRCGDGLRDVDPMRVAVKTITGLYDGASTRELDELSIRTAASLIAEEPEYSLLAARLLTGYVDKEVQALGVYSFSQSIRIGFDLGLINERVLAFVETNARKLNDAIDASLSARFEYFGLRTLYDRYLLKHPHKRQVIETPQHFWMRIACALTQTTADAIELYRLFATLDYVPSSPTLFNAGTRHEQLSSCFLLDSPADSLEAIYEKYKDIAQLSKFSGGIGVAWHRVRAEGSLIRSTNGLSNGIVPWLKTLDSSVAAVNQCFAPDTRVHTAKGAKAIRDIQPGDLVLGISGTYRTVTERLVYNQRDAMVALDVKHSIEPLHVTDGHPFYAIRGVPLEQSAQRTHDWLAKGKVRAAWVEAGQLGRGDYIAQVIPTETVAVDGFDEDDARLYGILLGDGHLSKNGSQWGVSGNPGIDSHLDFVRGYLQARGIHHWETARGRNYVQIHWAAGRGAVRDGTTGRITGAGAATLPFGHADLYDARHRKHIAPRFAHLPRPQALALLQGLIETDGTVSRNKEISFTNTSLPLIEGVRYQLLRLGVPCAGQYRERANTHAGARSDGSKVEFNGVTRSFDLRIPAIAEIAARLGCAALTKRNWIEWQSCVFSRVRGVEPVAAVPFVIDLKIDGDESYMTTAGLAHNGGKRKGAACVYLEPWHADVEAFLELRDNTGDEARRTHHLNLANWVPDLFMRRVDEDGAWSLFDPADVPDLPDLWGPAFEQAYAQAEAQGLAKKTLKARDLYAKMMRTLAQTGNGWMTFKDACNRACNQTANPDNRVHLSNLCTEIIEVTGGAETAVCNLGSINLARCIIDGAFDFDKLAHTVHVAVRQLDRVIDLNFYPIATARASNLRWRPVGLGLMGLQDVFFQLRLPFDSAPARALSARISEEIYYHALRASLELAREHGAHAAFAETRAARGELQFDAWNVTPSDTARWNALREEIKAHGLRNSLLIAIAPTATIASIAGCYECIEPQLSNLFKRETLSGDFLQVNRYLVEELKRLGLWTAEIRDAIKLAEGSVQSVTALPEELKTIYRTVWELPMRALIDMAAERGAFIDQSQSLNLFIENPNIGQLSSMYMYAWKKGLKTTYYLRSRPATKIAKATVTASGVAPKKTYTDSEAVVCSLENPEMCEACQ